MWHIQHIEVMKIQMPTCRFEEDKKKSFFSVIYIFKQTLKSQDY